MQTVAAEDDGNSFSRYLDMKLIIVQKIDLIMTLNEKLKDDQVYYNESQREYECHS